MEYKIYIEENGLYNSANVYAGVRRDETPVDQLSYDDGKVIATARLLEQQTEPFLKLPLELYKAIEAQIIENLERKGGAPSQQYLRGRVEELERQVIWLRSQVELIPYSNKPFTSV